MRGVVYNLRRFGFRLRRRSCWRPQSGLQARVRRAGPVQRTAVDKEEVNYDEGKGLKAKTYVKHSEDRTELGDVVFSRGEDRCCHERGAAGESLTFIIN
jgi:hypothetical protein